MFKRPLIYLSVFIAACASNESAEVYPDIENDGNHLTIKLGERPVLSYALITQHPHDSLPDYYQRSGFIHPLMTPNGVILTDDFPEGHTHQHGLFLALVNTTFQGKKTDFWNQQHGNGTVRHTELLDSFASEDGAGFVSVLEHLSLADKDTVIALQEIWEVDVLNREDVFVIDFKSILKALDTVIVHQYHYGGLGFRGSAAWNDLKFEQPGDVNYIGVDGKGGFLTSSGKSRVDGNHSHERWVSFHGTISDDSVGVVVMSHPENFRAPQAVRLHPTMPYFSISPMVDGEFILQPGDILTSRYRIITHDGYMGSDNVEQLWSQWLE